MRAVLTFLAGGNGGSTRGIPPALFYASFALLLLTNALTLTGLLMAPDISRLYSGQNDQIITAYEDRLAQMRLEIDRLQSRAYAQAGDINIQLQELSQQQNVLEEQHQLVRALVDKADQLGIAAADLGTPAPEVDLAALPSGGPTDVETARAEIARMSSETQLAMTGIATAARDRTSGIVRELRGLGISLDLPETDPDAVGGPLLAPTDDPDTLAMIDDANAVMDALVRFKAAKEGLAKAPVHLPLASGSFRQSSTFGNRKDPFTGRLAFHAGLDFAAPTGTVVRSAGDGTVTFAGQRAGYGNLVEVSHANGLVTRYGHLSGFIARTGDRVQTGTPIAKVGSTGRSTGPHLHFEVRKGNVAIDPKPYIDAGRRLIALMG